MKKYQVIGGQYVYTRHGESDTLQGAKMIASKNKEYWDNWKGWNTPKIYKAADCTQGNPTEFNFSGVYPSPDAEPVAICVNGKWEVREEKK